MDNQDNISEEEEAATYNITVRKRPAAKSTLKNRGWMKASITSTWNQGVAVSASSAAASAVPPMMPPAEAAATRNDDIDLLISNRRDNTGGKEDNLSSDAIEMDGGGGNNNIKKVTAATVSVANYGTTTADVTMADSAPSPSTAAAAAAAAGNSPSASNDLRTGSNNNGGRIGGGIQEQRNNLLPASAANTAAARGGAAAADEMSDDSSIEVLQVIPAVQSPPPPVPTTITTTTTTTGLARSERGPSASSAPISTTAATTVPTAGAPPKRVKREVERYSPTTPQKQKKRGAGSHQSPGSAKKKKQAKLSGDDWAFLLQNLETREYKDQRITVGSWVWASWKEDSYFWGEVTSKTKDIEGIWKYAIDFHDGDKRDNLTSDDLTRMDEAFKLRECGGTDTYKKPKMPQIIEFYQQEPLTMKEIRETSCLVCTQCRRRRSSCGNCRLCRQFFGGTPAGGDGCCFQKMCCNIITPRKAQPMAGFLPDTWRFYFDDVDANPEMQGLMLLTKEEAARVRKNKNDVEKRFLSFKDAVFEDPNAFMGYEESLFYDAVGVSPASGRQKASTGPAAAVNNVATRPRKSIPAKATIGYRHHQRQQMELDNDLRSEASTRSSQPGGSPSQQKPAASRRNDDSDDDVPGELCLEEQSPTASLESGSYTMTNNAPASLSELRRRKCGRCSACLAGDCGQCRVCKNNATLTTREKAACLQRMCIQIPEVERRQPADGFPDRWRFSIGRPDENIPLDNVLARLQVISPSGVSYKSVEKACNHYHKQLKNLNLDAFCIQIGVEMLEEVVDDQLQGKGFMNEWRNINGERKYIFGKVVRVYHGIGDENDIKYEVKYGDFRKEMVDTTGTALSIPETDVFDKDRAWAGCLAYEAMMFPQQRTLAANPPFCASWLVPQCTNCLMYNYRPTPGVDWVRLPELRLDYNEFRLTFKVKPSSIPNAGYGVFLAADAWDVPGGKPTHFRLPAGQLLDFGIYAPFRPEDRKSDHIFLMKNFAHNFICSEYSFDTTKEGDGDDIFDITDDHTGHLHAEARRHVTPYVNEIANEGEKATVNAKYDCEGALHYLLGHEKEEFGAFELELGREIEIFVDYGVKYESVRLRYGYPRIPVDEATKQEMLKKDEIEYIDEADSFNANEVKTLVGLFSSMLEQREQLKSDAIVRIILLLLLLKKRAQNIFMEFDGVEDDESVCDNGGRNTQAVLDSSRQCTFLIKRFVDVWGNSEDLLPTLREKEAYVIGAGKVFGEGVVASFTPVDFANRIRQEYI